jgi:hypothetical protein
MTADGESAEGESMNTEVLIHVDIDEETSFNLDEVQARQLYEKLKALFGEKEKWQYIPVYPCPPPVVPYNPYPYYPPITISYAGTSGNAQY